MMKQVHVVSKRYEFLLSLEKRAKEWAQIGGPRKERVLRQADEAYRLYLDFIEAGEEILDLGLDFPSWLSKHSGYGRMTCWRSLKAGRARATGSKPNRNQSGLIQEMRERETTPRPDLDWNDDDD